MAQKIVIAKEGKSADSTNPSDLIFSSDYNTLKYFSTNQNISFNINTSINGIYRETREITHGLGFKPFFKAYVSPSFLTSGAYLPVGFFNLISPEANAFLGVSVDDNKMYFVATGLNTDRFTGGNDIRGLFLGFEADYIGRYPVGTTPGNTGECVGLVMVWIQYYLNNPHFYGHAKDLYSLADPALYTKIPNEPTNYPQVGDIVVWNGSKPGTGGNGHTAVSTGVGNANTFEVFSQNDPTGSACYPKTYSNYNYVTGWLRPKGYSTSSSEPNHLQYSVTFKYKIFKNKLSL